MSIELRGVSSQDERGVQQQRQGQPFRLHGSSSLVVLA